MASTPLIVLKSHFVVDKLNKGFILTRDKQSREAEKSAEGVESQIEEQLNVHLSQFFDDKKKSRVTIDVTVTIEEPLIEDEV